MQLSLIEDISLSLIAIQIVKTLHFLAKKVAKFTFLQYTKKLFIFSFANFDGYQIIKHLFCFVPNFHVNFFRTTDNNFFAF